jgi:hypothetical protein
MDVSLLQTNSRHSLLRDILALKSRWPYYSFMVIDPLLRFAWIFYVIFTHDTQHSTVVSFLIAFAEVNRRGMWVIFRVENEHCANVAQNKASRDIPLPYDFSNEQLVSQSSQEEESPTQQASGTAATESEIGVSTGAQVPAADGVGGAGGGNLLSESPRRRRADTAGKNSILRAIAEAHKQDFEKKRKPLHEIQADDVEDEDCEVHTDDDDEDDGEFLEQAVEAQVAEDLTRGKRTE